MTEAAVAQNVQQAVPFFNVVDMQASLRFYVDGLGFRVTKSWRPDGPDKIRWCNLEHGGASLMLQEYLPQYRPAEKRGMGVSVWFICADALAFFRQAKARGVEPAFNPFVGNGMWNVGYVDPDGYDVHFESRTDVPEETEYDEAVHG